MKTGSKLLCFAERNGEPQPGNPNERNVGLNWNNQPKIERCFFYDPATTKSKQPKSLTVSIHVVIFSNKIPAVRQPEHSVEINHWRRCPFAAGKTVPHPKAYIVVGSSEGG